MVTVVLTSFCIRPYYHKAIRVSKCGNLGVVYWWDKEHMNIYGAIVEVQDEGKAVLVPT